jgi:DNA polymerase-3 subunit gamma/tau
VSPQDATLESRWPDVVDQVRRRNPLLAAIVSSAQPLSLDEAVLVVGFSTEHNRKSAERPNNRQVIETAFERVYGTAYRLRGTVASGLEGGANLLADPVINFAQRTFGGQPRRVPVE